MMHPTSAVRSHIVLLLVLGGVLTALSESQAPSPPLPRVSSPESVAVSRSGWAPDAAGGGAADRAEADATVTLLEDFQARQVFPVNNWWNQDVSQAPVDPGSPGFIDFLSGRSAANPTATRSLHPDFGPPPYGIPYVGVGSSQPLVVIGSFTYADQSDVGVPGEPPGYPIPVEARTLPNYIEGGVPGGGGQEAGDRHMLLIDRDRWLLFETYATTWNSALARWEAGSGAIFDLSSNARRPEGWTSADSAGLAIFPGLVRYDEVYGTAAVRHALRFTSRAVNGYVWPASHVGSSGTTGALPLGARLRLKASVDISGFSAPVRKIFQAMKTYGLILADIGSDLYITGTMDERWDNDVLNPAFAQLTADNFEVIKLGWKPAPADHDFTGDFRSDLLWRHATAGDMWLWTMSGTAPTSQSYVSTVGTAYAVVASGDFTGDGKTDLLWRHTTAGDMWLWTMNGNTVAGQAYVATVNPAYVVVGAGDFDGDGKADLLWRGAAGDLWMWLMNGAAQKSAAYAGTVSLTYTVQGVGDLDGDGRADLVWRGAAGDLWAWLMNGAAQKGSGYLGTVANATYHVEAVADFDGDRKADLLWRNSVAGDMWLWTMNGSAVAGQSYVATVSASYQIIGVGDFDGDAKADVLWRGTAAGDLWIWLMNGAATKSSGYAGTVADTGYGVIR